MLIAKVDVNTYRVLGTPGESQVGHLGTESLSDLSQLLDLFNLGFALGSLKFLDSVVEEALVGVEARSLRNTVVVLSSQETTSERRPDGSAVVVRLVQGVVLLLGAFTVEHVVLTLVSNGWDEVKTSSDSVGLLDLLSGPLGGSPVEALVALNQAVEGANNLFHGDGRVGTVSHQDIPVSETGAFQRSICRLDKVLPGQTLTVRVSTASTEEQLGDENKIRSTKVKITDGLAHVDLTLTGGVSFGGVEGVDTVLKGKLDDFFGLVTVDSTTVGEPPAEGEQGNTETRGAETAEDHVFGIIHGAVLWVGSGGSHFCGMFLRCI